MKLVDKLARSGNIHERVTFANGYGVSIVRNAGSYGHAAGLFEVAVLGEDGELNYYTSITSDVLGWQNLEDVLDIMRRVSAL